MREWPNWLKVKVPPQEILDQMDLLLRKHKLNTVCESARCPNLGQCFKASTATFMILGNICTRNCRFCAVTKGIPEKPDPGEPQRIAEAVNALNLKHVVVTGVTRDDLEDGGAGHFASTIKALLNTNRQPSVEVLVPDFLGNKKAIDKVLSAKPTVFNHNIETIPRLYKQVRPGADYNRSLFVLRLAKELNPKLITKSGLMVGLGETDSEIRSVMEALRKVGCDILTVGQYLQPSKDQLPVVQFVTREKFNSYKLYGTELGFLNTLADPLVRSSYLAGELISSIT